MLKVRDKTGTKTSDLSADVSMDREKGCTSHIHVSASDIDSIHGHIQGENV